MRICYLVSDLGGCGQYRCIIPGRELAERSGWSIDIQRGRDYSGPLPDADLYVFQRQTDPRLIQIAHDLRRRGKVVLGEVDDWFPGLAAHFGGTSDWVDPLLAVLRACDSVTVSTPFLAEGYGRLGITCAVVRNYLHWPMWQDHRVEPVGRLRIGYQGLALSHHPDLRLLDGVLAPWLNRHPAVRLVLAGGGKEAAQALGVDPAACALWPARVFAEIPTLTATMDVGLIPLLDAPFNHGKSWLKGLEYAACGIPAIASDLPEYREARTRGIVARLVRDAAGWLAALDEIAGLSGHDLRARGDAVRAAAREHSIDRHVGEWHDRFTAALDAGPQPITDAEPEDTVVTHRELCAPGAMVSYRVDGRDMLDVCCPGCGGRVAAVDPREYGISGPLRDLSGRRPVTFACCGGRFRLKRSRWKAVSGRG